MLDVEQAMLAEQFTKLLSREREAEQACAELLSKVSDLNARQKLEQVHREKVRHVQLVERLLEIVD